MRLLSYQLKKLVLTAFREKHLVGQGRQGRPPRRAVHTHVHQKEGLGPSYVAVIHVFRWYFVATLSLGRGLSFYVHALAGPLPSTYST